MDTDLVRSFIAVTETGSFTRAGDRIGRTQAAVSQQLKRLEELLGATLLRRSAAGVSLTSDGRRFPTHAHRLLAAEREALSAMGQVDTGGFLGIGMPEIYTATLLPPVLRRVRDLFPDITVSLEIRETAGLLALMRDGMLDFCFVTDRETPGLAGPVIHTEQVIWAGPPDGASLAAQRPLPVVLWRQGTEYRRTILSILSRADIPARIAVNTQSVGGMLIAAASGLGLAAVARSNVAASGMDLVEMGEGLPPLPKLEIRFETPAGRKNTITDRIAESLAEEPLMIA
ncbi:MAG: LysR family transcriptional regulator [Silicimonas sp.]|nr:LysR family transcriptional regulator [Silicimonas sp.]